MLILNMIENIKEIKSKIKKSIKSFDDIKFKLCGSFRRKNNFVNIHFI